MSNPERREISDLELAAYLDGALSADARAELEQALAQDQGAAQRLVALYRAIQQDTNAEAAFMESEKFLAGETLSFLGGKNSATEVVAETYEGLIEADEARRSRYLQSGN